MMNSFNANVHTGRPDKLEQWVQIGWASIPHFKGLDMRNLQYENFMINDLFFASTETKN